MKKLIITFLFLLSYFCLSWHSLGYAEKQYTITETELTQLEYNLSKLEKININSQNELATLKKNLIVAQDELATLKQESEKQEKLLQKANLYLQEYAKEERRTKARLKRQRNFAYCLCAGLVYVWAKK